MSGERICPACRSDRWVGWAASPGGPRRAQCVPCGHVGARIGPDETPVRAMCGPAAPYPRGYRERIVDPDDIRERLVFEITQWDRDRINTWRQYVDRAVVYVHGSGPIWRVLRRRYAAAAAAASARCCDRYGIGDHDSTDHAGP